MSDRILFAHANLLTGVGPAKPDSTVVVEGQRITRVSTGPIKAGPRDRVLDLAGKTLMPGLFSCHFHSAFGVTPNQARSPVLGLEAPAPYFGMLAVHNAQIALQAGITSVIGSSNPDYLREPERMPVIMKDGEFIRDALV